MKKLKDSKVRGYTDKELIKRVKSLPSYKYIPKNYWILGVRSNEDTYDVFDDKFYIFKGEKFIMVLPGTTNTGKYGLKHYDRWNWRGVAVVKADEWYYNLWKFGYHKGKMPALKQIRPIKYYRDNNKNKKSEEIGKMYTGKIGINWHTVLYSKVSSFYRKYIRGWSTGCQVVNHVGLYYKALNLFKNQKSVTYCLINEF